MQNRRYNTILNIGERVTIYILVNNGGSKPSPLRIFIPGIGPLLTPFRASIYTKGCGLFLLIFCHLAAALSLLFVAGFGISWIWG